MKKSLQRPFSGFVTFSRFVRPACSPINKPEDIFCIFSRCIQMILAPSFISIFFPRSTLINWLFSKKLLLMQLISRTRKNDLHLITAHTRVSNYHEYIFFIALYFSCSSGHNRQPVCPIDGVIIDNTFPDRFASREVLSLEVFCQYRENGCHWKNELRQYEVSNRKLSEFYIQAV